jgi:hypothetical protein
LANTVEGPDVAGKTAEAALPLYAGALGQANANITATHDCQVGQRERYAGGR